MGLLQRLFDLRQDLHQKLEGKPLASVPSAYQLKKEILQNCIYGVDIQPIAVEISKLRAFLSIVLEEEKTASEAQNLGIQPLPNLEFNFIIANSLVGLEAEMDGTFRGNFLAGVVKQINEIARLFFSADSPAKKLQAQQRFEAFRHNVETADDSYVLGEDKAKLLSFNPFNNNPSEFFEPHIQFGIEPDKNFGIVIGNPPYFVLKKEHPKAETYKEIYDYLQKGRLNIYQCFYGAGSRFLKEGGVLSYIHPKTLISSAYFAKTRKWLQKNLKHEILLNIVDRKGIFEVVTQAVMIALFSKGVSDGNCFVSEIKNKKDFLNLEYVHKPLSEIITKDDNRAYVISNNKSVYSIFKKMSSINKKYPLNFITGKIEWNKYKKYLAPEAGKKPIRVVYGEMIQRYQVSAVKNRKDIAFINNYKGSLPVLEKKALIVQRTTSIEQENRIIATIVNPKSFSEPIITENNTSFMENSKNAHYLLGILLSKALNFYFNLTNSNVHVSAEN